MDYYTVSSTLDEFGEPRFFVESLTTGDWVSEAFNSPEAAQEEIHYMRREHTND